MDDKRKALYDALSGEYNLGSYEEFTEKLNDENKRKALYDAAGQDYNLGTYEEYSTKLGFEPNAIKKDNAAVDGSVPMFDDEPQAAPAAENVEENSRKLRGLWANFKESSKGLWAGLKGYAGEQLNMFSGSSREEQAALNDIEQLEQQGIDVTQYLADKEKAEFQKAYGMSKEEFMALDKKERKELIDQATDRMVAQQPILDEARLKEQIRQQTNQKSVEDAFRKALEAAGGDMTKAKAILREQAADKTKGDVLIEEATETMSNLREPEGFAGWVGNLLPQMIPATATLALNYLTKGKASGLSKAIGFGTMGGLTLSTAGMSMIEARNAGATNLEVWLTGIADGAIEIISEKIPFDRVTKRVFSSAKANVAKKLGDAVLNPKGRAELEKLLSDANEKLGGRLFSKKNVGEWLKDTAYEAAGEFTAEALQTITTMIYENPEDYPTISEVLANGWEGAKAGLFMGAITGGASHAAAHSMNKDRRMAQGYVDVAQIENEDGDVEVVEVVGEDPQSGNITILHNDELESVSREKIGDRFRFSYEEFENARLREMEDEAIESGNVTEGQIQGLEDNIARDIEEIKALAPEMTESEISAILQSEMAVDPDTPLGEAVAKYQEDVARHGELVAVKREADAAKKEAIRTEIETAVGQRFWVQESGEDDGSGIIPVSETVEEVVYADGRVGYVVGSDESGNLTMVYTDGTKGFSSRAEITEKENSGEILSNTVMGLDDYLAVKMDIEEVTREKARMQEEHALSVEEMIATHPQGSVINVGTEEAKIEVPIIAPPTKDGVIVQMPDGTTPMLTWEDVAHAEKKEITPKTDAQLNQSIVDEYRVAYTPAVPASSQPTQQKEEQVKRTSPANPLPLKADGSVDQTALWNKDPEGWAQWNDEKRQDGGADSLAYVTNAIAVEQAKMAELQTVRSQETDFDRRDALDAEIATAQERIDRLVAIQQGYLAQPAVANAVQNVQPEPQTEEEKAKAEDQRREPLRKRAKEFGEKLGVKVNIAESLADVKEEQAREEILGAEVSGSGARFPGWYDRETGEVTIYLPHVRGVADIDRTIIHEVVAHKGLRGLLGKEGYNVLCDAVWDMMTEAERAKYMAYPGVNGDKRLAADEYIARFAEGLDLEQSRPIWNKIAEAVQKILNSMGIRLEVTKEDLADLIAASYMRLQEQARAAQTENAPVVEEVAEEVVPETTIEQQAEVEADIEEVTEESTSPIIAAAQQDKGGISFNVTTEEPLQDKIRKFAQTEEGKATGWTEDDIESIIAETESLIDAIHRSSTGNEFYDEFAYKEPTIRVDWRDGEAKPIVTWTRANIEYKYDMSADLLCINNEGLEKVLSSDKMVALMEMFVPEKKAKKGEPEIKFTSEDYLELYNTLKDLGFVVPCKGCFDAAGRFKMLPSVAQKFAAEVNALIDERNKDPKAFDEKLKAKPGEKTVGGLPATAATKSAAIAAGVAGDNLTEHVKWTQLMSADGQTKMLSDWGGIFRAWQRTGAGRPKDKLLPEPYYGDIVSSVSTIIGKYGEKTPSFRDTLVNQGTGLRRNSHSEFRPVLAIDEIQFMRDAFIRNLTVFKYMKELDDVRLFGKMGVKFNMSFFPEYVPGTKVAGLDKEGNYIASEESVGSREFPYQGEDGKRHYDGMKGWEEAQKHINKDVSLSSVIFSIPHLLKALTDVPTPSDMRGIWGSLIPFHSSGATTASLAMQGLGMARANGVGHGFSEAFYDYGKGVTNFEAVQNDRFGEGWHIVSGTKAGTDVEPGHKLEFVNGNHYYNKALGVHLFASGYILDSELPAGVLGENGELDITNDQKKALMHKFTIDYNDKVRELKGPYAYKDAADFYIAELPKLGLIPRFDFEVSEEKFLEMCEAANVDPRHPKLGWKGEGNSWSPIDSEAYYSLFCDYGMTDPATGEWAPHMPVGYVNEEGEREFRLPENAVEIVKEGLDRFSGVRRSENARIDEAIETFAERSVEKGRISQKSVDKVLGKKSVPTKPAKPKKSGVIDLVEEAKKAVEKTSNISFSFIGERGAANDKTLEGVARLDNLETARQMESQFNPDWSAKENEAALKIKVATGWERGADGLWRYEILDGNIKDNPALERTEWYVDGEMRYEYVGKLPDLYDNPELYRMYPFLKDTTVEINPYRMGSEDGSYNKAINLIKLVSSYRKWVINHSDRYHEIIKNLDNTIEDMSDEEAAAYLDEWETSDEAKELQELMKKEVGHYEVGFTEWEKEGYAREILLHEIQHAIQGYEGFAKGTSGRDPNYNVYGGEVESRNASRRMRMSPEERRNTLLAATEDVARKDQIFLMDAVAGDAQNNISFRMTTEMKEIKEKAQADGTFMKAPNGQPTNLTEEQWLMVRTKNFINWFGNWENDPENASKVVDENGEPKVVYHQTNQKIYVNRETGENWDELGWKEKMEWDNRDDWEDYWEEQDFNTFSRVNARTTNEFDGFFFAPEYDEYHEYGDRTIAAFVNIKNPASREDYNIDSRYNDAGRNERIRLQEAGFDGVIRMDGDNVDEYIAFEPNQIKSATDNNGDFNPKNNNISFRVSNENQAIFVSNAARAVEGIKMEKATPEQWLKMLEKAGGLKAGEDKWMGLSDWLKASDKKTLTKQEVLDFINEHMIVIEEQHYSNDPNIDKKLFEEFDKKYPGNKKAFIYEYDDYREKPYVLIDNLEAAVELYNANHEDKVELDEFDSLSLADEKKVEEFGNQLAKEQYELLYYGEIRSINSTRLQYTTEGLNNNHEIALTVPTIESWNEGDDTHFGDAGEGRAVAWIRFGDASKWVPEQREDGKKGRTKKVLVIDEIQSKRHQEGREKGYKTQAMAERAEAYRKLLDAHDKLYDRMLEKYGEQFDRASSPQEFESMMSPEDFNALNASRQALNDVRVEMQKEKHAIPDAPFDKNWHELAMKRMLRYAAENGYDVIAWTKGEQQAERYGIGKVVSSVVYRRTEDGKRVRVNMRGGESLLFDVDVLGKVTEVQRDGGVVTKGMPLSEIVGSNLANQIGNYEGEVDERGDYNIKSEDFRIGGEGMRGFYDRMLPAFMNKYGKKWGVKVEDIELPNLEEAGRVMHSVPVTEEMKASVMGGQVMFRMRTEEEDAMEFQESVLEEFKQEYRLPAPTTVVDVYDRDAVANALGYAPEKFTDAQYDFIMKGYQKGGVSIFDPETKRIAIFAKETLNESWKMYDCIFHENTHFLVAEHPDLLELGEWLWQNSEPLMRKTIKEHILANDTYKGYETDEMLSGYTGVIMATGKADVAYAKTPEELRKHWDLIFNAFGYGRKTEDNPRRRGTGNNTGRVESSGNRADASAEQKHNDAAKQELTAEERRIIGEYFPEFNKEDNSKGNVSFRFIGEKGAEALDKAEEATVRLDNLAVARQMEEAGKDAKAIKLATGWERGADNLWRYETADFSLKPTWINATTLEEAIKDDELFKAYPELRKTKVRLVHNSTDVGGKFSKAQNSIEAIGYSFESMQDTLVHEVQHAIQEQEGFEGGGNPMIANAAVAMEWMNKYAAIYDNSPLKKTNNAYSDTLDIIGMMDNLRQLRTDKKNSEKIKDAISTILVRLEKLQNYLPAPELKKEFAQRDLWPSRIWDTYAWLDNYQGYIIGLEDSESITDEERKAARIKELMRDSSGMDAYHAITGEVEARNATKRRAMSYIERRQSLASETEDVAREDHLFINGALEELAKVMEKMQKGNVSFRTSLDLDEEFGDALFKEESTADENGVSFRVVTDSTRIEELEDGPKVEAYRAVQIDKNGKIYSPMASRLKSTKKGTKQATNEAAQMNQWDEAVESLDKVDENGRITILDEDGGTTKVSYNPYGHCCVNSMMNDQFKRAWERDGLYVMKVLAPESELTAGYHAEKAKDAVGIHKWKTGAVGNKLPENKRREILLTRWMKNVQVMPWEAVAQDWIKTLEGENIDVPFNVVPRKILNMLAEAGVKIVEPEKGMENATKAYEQWLADPKGYVGNTELPDHVKALNEETDDEGPDNEPRFRTTGTPTDEVVANGLTLSPAQTAEVAANIFAALPEESREKITDGLNGNILGLQDAIMQIPASLATKENWNEEDRAMADVVAEEMTKMAGEMTRPFSAPEALWLLYNNLNKGNDLISQASRALVQRNLGFDEETLERQEEAKRGVSFRMVGDATANAKASMYNRGAVNVWTRLKESFVDMQASVEELVSAIEKATGKEAKGFENILLALNQQSSKGLAAMESYEQRFLMPMFDEVRKIMDKAYAGYDTVVRYVILKHGLERNKKLAQRDAKAHYQEIYDEMIAKVNSMDDSQKRTYLTNAQLQDADAKAKLATLKAADTSAFTEEEKNTHKRELAKAKEEVKKAKENLERAQKINSMSEQELKDELDKIFEKIENGTDSVYKELRKNDYSGISSMFYDQLGVNRKDYSTEEEYQAALMLAKNDRFSSLEEVETQAEGEVSSFEGRVDTKELWKRINAATKETLRQQYEANMISKDQYESLRNMFEYYVPLRGFKDNTAEDMYTYYRKPNSTGYTKPILGAEGRKTEAESPFGWIAAMAGSAIASNVKNEAKLALYYFVSNRPNNGIATLSRTWFVHTPGDVDANGKKIFKPAYPPFSEDLSSDAAKQAYEDWQEQMRELQKQGLAYEAGQRLNLGNAVVNISDANKPEHVVTVKVAGKDYTIVINGNPRAAQAINGELNIESTADDYSAIFGPVLRWMSSVNTSYNPEFWITNLMRDMAFTWMAVNTKEDPAYRKKFSKNYWKCFRVIGLVAKNEKGTIGNSYIEDMYKDFVKYGGVTGYTQIKDSETWEKEIDNYLSSTDPESLKNGRMMRGMKTFFHAAHRFGESLEQVSRFAAFLTSREMGKTINEAIADAKEITVNFNRKGSGKMITLEESKYLTDKNGQPLSLPARWAAVGLSSIAPLGRRTIMFFNAAVQGLNSVYRLWKKNPKRLAGWTAAYFTIGVLNAAIHALLDDDDDYLDIPQYERRNSLMLGGNGAYLKWALPQEARAFYALGDLAVETILGRNPHQNVVGEAMKIATEVLPVNPTEGWKAFVPSVAIPAVELMLNEDYKGAPIYNEQKWLSKEERERTAKWSSAYQGTGAMYKGIAQGLNYITGGDKHDAGKINLQPEKMEHIVQSAFGGTIRTADKFINTIWAMFDPEEDVTVRQTPFLNRILTINDERFKNVHVNEVFDYYKADADHALTLEKKYRKDRDQESLNELRRSDEYQWAKVYRKYKKALDNLKEKLKVAEGTAERKELMRQQDELKRRVIKEISEL